MNNGRHTAARPQTGHGNRKLFKRAPIAHAALLLMAASALPEVHAQQAFSPAWFAAKGAAQNNAAATGYLPNGTRAALLANPAQQQQQANAQLQRSLNNLGALAQGIAAQQAAQEAARQAALANGGSVPDGLTEGGLKVDTNSLTRGWINASTPVQGNANGKTTVSIAQSADKAILNWETFNVGKNTLVNFQQQANWAVLNRVNDPLSRPSQIQGQVSGNGTVLIVNRNGIVFAGSSQVDVRNLVAAAANISDSQFREQGLYGKDSSIPSFTDANGKLIVQAGARIATAQPASVTQGGGYVLLLGGETSNAGQIETRRGQALLAAGDSFIIRKGVGTDGNTPSTTRGNEVAPRFNPASTAGEVSNHGLLVAREGDVTLAGRHVGQHGVAVASTTVNTRGTIHLLNSASDRRGTVRLGAGAVTAVLLEDDGKTTALDSQRDALIADSARQDPLRLVSNVGAFDNLSVAPDRRDQSRIEIVSGGNVLFEGDSLTIATGGQIAASAAGRNLVAQRATLDVAGAVGVPLTMESNNVKINIQGNELRDAPLNRDGGKLINGNVWIDARALSLLPAGTGGYAADRWYTAGGLLEVGGYLANTGHRIGEWAAPGGTVTLGGREVVTQAGALVNIAGGTLDVQSGYLNVSWLKGSDGRLYDINRAPGGIAFTGVYRGFESLHPRWGKNTAEYFYNPLIAPQRVQQNGYTIGRDAGRLIVDAPTAILEATVAADVYNGPQQVNARSASRDAYQQRQLAVARAGVLALGGYGAGGRELYNTDIRIGRAAAVASTIGTDTPLAAERLNTAWLDAVQLSAIGLGGLELGTRGRLNIDTELRLADGAFLDMTAPVVDIAAGVTARGGRVTSTNIFVPNASLVQTLLLDQKSSVRLGAQGAIDVRGVWSNVALDPSRAAAAAYVNGGSIALTSTGSVNVESGALLDVSSGATVSVSGKQTGGRGGDVSLSADNAANAGTPASLRLDGQVRGYGVNGGGKLRLQTGAPVVIGAGEGALPAGSADAMRLDPAFFRSGFSDYTIASRQSLVVAENTRIDVEVPVYRWEQGAGTLVAGSDPAPAVMPWMPPVYQDNPLNASLRQRAGASLRLEAGAQHSILSIDTARLEVRRGASIHVDPLQKIELAGLGQITIDGQLQAPGGVISVRSLSPVGTAGISGPVMPAHQRSLWIGDQAVLDVAGRAVVATDARGNRYGKVLDGGSITLGGMIDPATSGQNVDSLFVVLRPGALLDASGSGAVLDAAAGVTPTVAGKGGVIRIGSAVGMYLDGEMRAASGGAGAPGGTLELALGTTLTARSNPPSNLTIKPRELIVSQQQNPADMLAAATPAAAAAAGSLVYGHGTLAASQVTRGGFDNLSLSVNGQIGFAGDLDLRLGQSLQLYAVSLALAESSSAATRVALTAPYVRLAGQYGLVFDNPQLIEVAARAGAERPAAGSLRLSASLLEVRDRIGLGAHGVFPQTGGASLTYDRRGFADFILHSEGDLRLVAPGYSNATVLTTADTLRLEAAQIYPATRADTVINARRLETSRTTSELPALPYSVFGSLALDVDVIEHGGVLRAPLGNLIVGLGNLDLEGRTGRVDLLPGSVTSVSARGLLMPYGGTVDGVTYAYADIAVSNNLLGVQPMIGAVHLRGRSVNVARGATIDLAGGGELTGAGFISGRGGSVDVLRYPLATATPANGYSQAGNLVFAIVPGSGTQYAPAAPDAAANPAVGQQVTFKTAIPGLPAGTYTLLPSTYALLPGAFRVEIPAGAQLGGAVAPVGNGTYVMAGTLGIANTAFSESLQRQVVVTPADVVRTHAQYNETGFSRFALNDAARLGIPRTRLAADARNLDISLTRNPNGGQQFSFDGELLDAPLAGGWRSRVSVNAGQFPIEVVAAGNAPSAGFVGVSVSDQALNGLHAGQLLIGGSMKSVYGQGGNFINFNSLARSIHVRSGATLSASDIFLISGFDTGGIFVEQGARLNTLGRGAAGSDSRDGFVYAPLNHSVLAVSNGYIRMLTPEPTQPNTPFGPGRIEIGGCSLSCTGVTGLYSEGTIVVATDNLFRLDDAVRYGTRNLTLSVGGVNVGTEQTLQQAAAAGRMPAGLSLNQQMLDKLLRGDVGVGAPALESLTLNSREAFNLFGTVTLDTIDPATGLSRLKELVLSTPGMYGYGAAGDVATIRTDRLIWNGSSAPVSAVLAGGPGTGGGALAVQARQIELSNGLNATGAPVANDRLALGFASVNLIASERVTASGQGSLAVYRSQGAYVAGSGFTYTGGDLNIVTPLLTGENASINRITVGGDVRITGNATAAAATDRLGGELSIQAANIVADSAIVLPSGKLALTATGELTLADGARIDASGRTIGFGDISRFSAGGEVVLKSTHGNIVQQAGARIDLSARNNQGGRLTAIALDSAAGVVDLRGTILGAGSGEYDAGGTLVPYRSAMIDLRAQRLGAGASDELFAQLNQRLNDGGVLGGRSFQLKQGDLVIGDGLRGREIDVSLDGGRLTVTGTIDASGAQVGSIRLAANQGLTLAGTALLDAHGERLRVDSYGKIIDSPNRAIVELSSGNQTLTLAAGARIDLRHGTAVSAGSAPGQHDGAARGTLELNAPVAGGNDIAIDAAGPLDIRGARSIAVNAVQRHADAPTRNDAASGRPYQVIDQDYLNAKAAQADLFIDAALANGALMNGKLGGLNNAAYRNAFHLRPTIEIDAAGDLLVRGDLDLSRHRYRSINPNSIRTGVYGSGEVGTLVLRAGGNLDIHGSINDGFAPPPATPADNGWVLLPGFSINNADVVIPRTGIQLADGTVYRGGVTLNYDLPIQPMTMAQGTRLPAAGALAASVTLPANTVLAAAVRNADGSIAYAAGTRLPTALTLSAGMILDAGTLLVTSTPMAGMLWPKGVALPHLPANMIISDMDVVYQSGAVDLKVGHVIPARTDIKLPAGVTQVNLREGAGTGVNWAVAPMLPEGSQSWSLRLVAGADLAAADTRRVDPAAANGSLRLADLHYGMNVRVIPVGALLTERAALDWWGDPGMIGQSVEYAWDMGYSPEDFCLLGDYCQYVQPPEYIYTPAQTAFSVLRTGTGDLELVSARDLSMQTLYGVYTAGTSSLSKAAGRAAGIDAARGTIYNSNYNFSTGKVLGARGGEFESLVDDSAGSLYRAWYPEHGGNLLLSVGGNLTGDTTGQALMGASEVASSSVGNWLWRQAGGTATDVPIPSAWWINFGTYVATETSPRLAGFTGFGTLGGGNLTARVGGEAGMLQQRGYQSAFEASRSQALVLAVASSGRVLGRELQLTGGGDLELQVSGGLNAQFEARAMLGGGGNGRRATRHDLNGEVTNLRGNIRIEAGAIGGIVTETGAYSSMQDPRETRAYDPFRATVGTASGGMVIVPGDATVSLSARGDLVLGTVADPTRVPQYNSLPFTANGVRVSDAVANSWFSLWTRSTAIDLFAAGGNLTPITAFGEIGISNTAPVTGRDYSATDGRHVYPSILRATAANGNLYYGPSGLYDAYGGQRNLPAYSLLLAPGSNGRLEFLAAGSIYAGGYAVSPSSADPAVLATPFNPAFAYREGLYTVRGNVGNATVPTETSGALFAFGGTGASDLMAGASDPVRFYARDGDIVGLRTGEIVSFEGNRLRPGVIWYEGARPVYVVAGRDIVNSGTQLGQPTQLPSELSGYSEGNLFVHHRETDLSIVTAGRDLIYSSFNVAGPGALEVSAGRNIIMEDKATLKSLGPAIAGDRRDGASISVIAGNRGLDYEALRRRYLDPANLAAPGQPLAQQPDKVAASYEGQLRQWLADRYGFNGTAEQARTYFAALAPEHQRLFLRAVYYEELRLSGREFNDADSPRYGSYLRGREMIATFLPDRLADDPAAAQGELIMYGGAGVQSAFGGNVELLVPHGGIVVGLQGRVPPGSAGIVTQGRGDIRIFSRDSLTLGLSRVMTTFGGDIFAWSERGDINAGRGAKTTVVFTPPRRSYDDVGNVTLAPQAPSSGAGIATLNPIPEIAPGDVDLIAPLGTIDAGEAGIRVSGNVNLAALRVVNAENIQVQGQSKGIPVVAAVNTGALTNASAAASTAAAAAQEAVARERAAARQNLPSVFTVRVLGFGNEPVDAGERRSPSAAATPLRPSAAQRGGPVQVIGMGAAVDAAQRARLTEQERRALDAAR